MNSVSKKVLPVIDMEEAGYYLSKMKEMITKAIKEHFAQRYEKNEITFIRIVRPFSDYHKMHEFYLSWIASLTNKRSGGLQYVMGSVGAFQEKGIYSSENVVIKVSIVNEAEREYTIEAFSFTS